MNQTARYTPAYRRQQIITAASALFEAQGYEKTTVDQIAREAGLSHGLIYRYYKNKQAIFTACTQHLAILQVQGIPTSKTKAPAKQRYQQLVKRLLGYSIAHNRYQALQNATTLDAFQRDELAEQMIPALQEIIEEGVYAHTFYCKNPALTARFLSYGILHYLPPDLDPTSEELAQYLDSLYILTDAILFTQPPASKA